MSDSGLIGFLQILKGVGSGRPQDHRKQFWGLRGKTASNTVVPKRYRHADGRAF